MRTITNIRYFLKIGLLLSFAFLQTHALNAQQYTEYEVKAAYLVNFIKFVEWPQKKTIESDSIGIIGVYGGNKFGNALESILKNRTVGGKCWIVKYFNTPGEVVNCDILFISGTNGTDYKEIIDQIKGKSVLTVGDDLIDFCRNGGIINFSKEYPKKAFEINNMAAHRQGLEINSKLLFIAEIIEEDVALF